MRFPIAYGRSAPLLAAIGLPKKGAYVDTTDESVEVRMGWGFRAEIPQTSITHAEVLTSKVWSIGIHGWSGRWLVNGARDRLVKVTIDPPAKANVGPVRVNLRELKMSLEEPDKFAQAVTTS